MADVTIKYTGLHKRMKKLFNAKDPHVKVGILLAKGGGKTREGGITMVELAAIHEFGSPKANIPQRSFIRSAFQDPTELQKISTRVVKALIDGKVDLSEALDIIGSWGATQVRNNVTQGDGIAPPLKPETVQKKGSSRPLIDTGRMINSVTWEVRVR